MDRSEFIGKCSQACLAMVVGGAILESCAVNSFIPISEMNGELRVNLSLFIKEGSNTFKRYLLVKPDSLDYPVVIYRMNNEEYSALLLRCTHQGTQLNVYGDLISCTAHGSEFNNAGDVLSGPATNKLKKFRTRIENDQLILETI